jgi:hypothetical protein
MPKNIGDSLMTKIVLGIAILLSFLFLGAAVYQKAKIEKIIGGKQEELKTYKDEGLGRLNSEKNRLEKQLNSLEEAGKKMTGILFLRPGSKMSMEAGDPLKFKEELYKVQNKIKEDGAAANFQFPFWLGFDRYKHDIPSSADLPYRVKQLDIIKEIGNLALASKVPEILGIDFLEIKKISAENNKEILYMEFPVKIILKCKNENLINFLYKFSVADIPFRIDSFKIKVSAEEGEAAGGLTTELVVVAAILSAEKT